MFRDTGTVWPMVVIAQRANGQEGPTTKDPPSRKDNKYSEQTNLLHLFMGLSGSCLFRF